MRPSSPLLDSVRDQFEDYDQLAKDFTRVFLNDEPSCLTNAHLFDVVFLVGQSKQKARLIGVRAILGVRSRVFQVSSSQAKPHIILSTILHSFPGNALWHSDWLRFAANTRCRDIRPSGTFACFAAKSKTQKQQLSNRTRFGFHTTQECTLIADGEACLLAPGNDYGGLGTFDKE